MQFSLRRLATGVTIFLLRDVRYKSLAISGLKRCMSPQDVDLWFELWEKQLKYSDVAFLKFRIKKFFASKPPKQLYCVVSDCNAAILQGSFFADALPTKLGPSLQAAYQRTAANNAARYR